MPRICEISRVDTFFVEVQEDSGEFADYRKTGSGWEKRYGESWEPVFDEDMVRSLNFACEMFWGKS